MKKRESRILAMSLAAVMAAAPLSYAAEQQTDTVQEIESEAVSEAETEALTESLQEAEEPAAVKNYDELVVGNTTHMNGDFFTDMWGNATSDIDVRKLIHGYDLIEWDSSHGMFTTSPTVVTGIAVIENEEGDRTYRLSLYSDLAYSDGTHISAFDYAFSILLSMAPQMKEIGARTGRTEYIVGAKAYEAGETDVLSGVRVLSEDELEITVSHEYLPYFYELGLLNFVPYPIQVIAPGCKVESSDAGVRIINADPEAADPLFTSELLAETILDEETGYRTHPSVVSGPYVLTAFDGETAEFEVNPLYKGDVQGIRPRISKLKYTLAENSSMIEKLEDGTFGLLNKVSNAEALQQGLALVSGSSDFSASNYARVGLSFISFCADDGPAEELAVRQAAAFCLPKAEVADAYEKNYGIPVDGFYGMGQWMYTIIGGNVQPPVPQPEPDASQEELDDYTEQMAEWKSLTLDNVPSYDLGDADKNLAAAVSALEGAGWSLNESGEPFDAAADEIRYKDEDGTLVPLALTLDYPEGNAMGAILQEQFVPALAQAGIGLTLVPTAMSELLGEYYGTAERDCDMVYLATNFDEVFDPSADFTFDEDDNAYWNGTGIQDNELFDLAMDMRATEPGETLEYCRKWVAYQERFMETLPAIPVYSNVYFDFYTSSLQNYDPMTNVTWSLQVLGAWLGDPSEEAETEVESEEFIG